MCLNENCKMIHIHGMKRSKDEETKSTKKQSDIKQQRLRDELAAISKIKTNPKAFYTFAKKSKTPSVVSYVGPLLDRDNQLQSDPVRMQELSAIPTKLTSLRFVYPS